MSRGKWGARAAGALPGCYAACFVARPGPAPPFGCSGGLLRPGQGLQGKATVVLEQPGLDHTLRLQQLASLQARQLLQTQGVIEAWLFQNDGRFALKTLARPQKAA